MQAPGPVPAPTGSPCATCPTPPAAEPEQAAAAIYLQWQAGASLSQGDRQISLVWTPSRKLSINCENLEKIST